MALRKHEKIFSAVPPTLEFLAENFPHIAPNQTLDRSIPRCKLCDLIAAQERARVAENPPPGISVIEEIERDIELTEKMIKERINIKEHGGELVELKQKLDDAIILADIRIQEAWRQYWAIWGPGEGPQVVFDTIVDESEEDLIDSTGEFERRSEARG